MVMWRCLVAVGAVLARGDAQSDARRKGLPQDKLDAYSFLGREFLKNVESARFRRWSGVGVSVRRVVVLPQAACTSLISTFATTGPLWAFLEK